MASLADLGRVAGEAQRYRFSDLEQLLPALDGDRRRLAIRLALLPLGGGDHWAAIKGEVLGDLGEELIDDLALDRILEARDPPGFGHAKRGEAARGWFVDQRTALCRAGSRGDGPAAGGTGPFS